MIIILDILVGVPEPIKPGDLVAVRDSEKEKWNLYGNSIYIAEDKVHDGHVVYEVDDDEYYYVSYVIKKSKGEIENKKRELLKLIDEAGLTKEDLFE